MTGHSETLFISGMRRSGTTIVLDTLLSARHAHGVYEPLAAARRAAVGGGSGVRDFDYFEPVRAGRQAFVESNPQFAAEEFNYGAPAKPLLEYETTLPEHVIDYLRSLKSDRKPNIFKFTRMHHKISELRRVDDQGSLVVVVRDPRAVVTSYLYGKNQKHKQQINEQAAFFDRASPYSAWSSGAFFDYLTAEPEFGHLQNCPDYLKVALVWWDNVRASIAAAQAHFEGRWYLLRHHDFCRNPRTVLDELQQATGFNLPAECAEWAEQQVTQRQDIHMPQSHNWDTAYDALDMRAFLDAHRLLNQA